MTEEVKQVRMDWFEKSSSFLGGNFMFDVHNILQDIDRALMECNEILGEVGLGTGYVTKQMKIAEIMEQRCTFHSYIQCLPEYICNTLDQPLYEDFNKKATESISRIRLEDCQVRNNLGLTEDYYQTMPTGGMPQNVTRLKPALSFADFIGNAMGDMDVDLTGTTISNGCVEEFASIFASQYEAIKAMGVFDGGEVPDLQEYLTQFATQGEFYNQMDQPFLSFVSSALDITVLKPIIESAIGEDLITGEDLSDFECDMKQVFAIIDMVTLGQAIAATKLMELGGKEALEVLGKTLLIEFTSNAAATGMASIGEALNLPTSITILLSLGTGLGVSLEANKLLFRNAAGDLLREVQLDDNQLRSIGEVMDDADGWSFNGGLLNGVDEAGKSSIYDFFKLLNMDEQFEMFAKMSSEEIYQLVKSSPDSWIIETYDLITPYNAKDFITITKNALGEISFNLNWPKYGGYEPSTISGIADLNGRLQVSRDGGDGGYTMGIGKNPDGNYANNSQRAIPKSSAEVNTGVFDVDLYKATVDIVASEVSDVDKIKKLVDMGIDDDIAEDLLKDYKNWMTRPEIVGENNISDGLASVGKDVDPKYGYYGNAAGWNVGGIEMSGGAGQMNTVYSWGTLKEAGIISDIGKATIY